MTNGNTCAVKWIHVYNNVEMRIRWNGYVYLFMSEYGRDESAPTPGGVFRGYFVGVRCIINNPFAAKWQAVSSCRGWFIVPVYTCSPHIRKTLGHICNPFETHLCNVRNVFVICVLHIRRVKVWFLRCKSMVFGVQKGGFCIAKVWFLIFECYVVANRSHAFRGWMWEIS